ATPEEDDALAQEMLDSPKDRQEHAFVVSAVRERVRPYAKTMDVPDQPQIYRLQNIQHLYTPVRAELETHFDVLDLVGELHPTPALGGSPRRAALEAIDQLETEERGWYAAPVGWVDANGDGVFAVAIRSAVSAGNRARLYAGVGVVAESDPDKEWEETGWKFKPLLTALGVTDGSA
ncbi:MAG TPA: chorismate-binding protein, partial [Oceanobacillus sp.]|nr:chorismate-binding protein [Oceanobacillus sp.]